MIYYRIIEYVGCDCDAESTLLITENAHLANQILEIDKGLRVERLFTESHVVSPNQKDYYDAVNQLRDLKHEIALKDNSITRQFSMIQEMEKENELARKIINYLKELPDIPTQEQFERLLNMPWENK